MRFFYTLVISLIFLSNQTIYGQTAVNVDQLTDDQIQEFFQKAQSSGMSEQQIEQMALQRGYTQQDVNKMRERINRIKQGESQSVNNENEDIGTRKQSISVDDNKKVQGLLSDSKKSLVDSNKMSLGKEVYGASFFKNAALSFEPNLRIPTPRNYLLGPDDELNIEMFGSSVKSYKLKVSPEGTVRLENSGPIMVSGLSIEDARNKIGARIRQLYSMPGIGINITLGSIRSINVTITGEVIHPGTYTVSSLSTVFNAIYQSGGPNKNGTFRNIQLRRENKIIRNIDLYDFLLNGDDKDNIGLKDQDILVFPDFSEQIEFEGEVRRPMIFEIKPGETLKDLIRFAGGFTNKAYTATISARRNTSKELKILTVDEGMISRFVPQNGDLFMIGTILKRFENRVQIGGSVFRPGEYSIDSSLRTVKQLILKADGIRGDAFMDRAFIHREKPNLEIENISFDLGKLLNGQIDDIAIQRQDSLTILSINDLREKYTVSISGSVNKVGNYNFLDNMSIGDIITLSGGFQEGAIPYRIEVSRRITGDSDNPSSTQNSHIFTLSIDKDLKLNENDQHFILKPYDVVFVRSSPNYESQQLVGIYGQIKYPGLYTIETIEDKLADLIRRSGGLKADAYIKASRFYRRGEMVAVDLESILNNPNSNDNLKLINMDSLVIPKKDELVRIKGAVLNPSTVNYEGSKLMDYISQAGGFDETASKKRIYIVYANGRVARTKRPFLIRSYPKVESGSQIIIPVTDDGKKRKMDPSERIAVFSLLGSILIATGSVLASILRN